MVSPRLLGTAFVLLLLLAGSATWLSRGNAESTPNVTAVVVKAETGKRQQNTQTPPTLEVEMTAYTSAVA